MLSIGKGARLRYASKLTLVTRMTAHHIPSSRTIGRALSERWCRFHPSGVYGGGVR